MLRCFKRKLLLLPALSFCCLMNAQSPGGVGTSSGLTGWFKANSSNVTVTGATNKVTSWSSETGSMTLTQGNETQQPFYFTTVDTTKFNFNPFLRFTSANTTGLAATTTTPDLMGTQGTVFIIANRINTSTAFTYSVNSSYRWQIKPGFRSQVGLNGNGWTTDFIDPVTASDSSAFIITSKGNGDLFRSRKNGDSLALVNTNDATYNPAIITGGLYVGWNGSNELFNGCLGEMITYNTILSDADINKVESYLALKYGITLSQNSAFGSYGASYRSSGGLVIWDATANTGYSNCITGIGRDDASGFLQKQSRSVHYNSLAYVFNGTTGAAFPSTNSANSSVISTDASFLLIGDNGLSKNLSACTDNGFRARMARVWKVQKTGTGISAVTIAIDRDSVSSYVKSLVVSTNPLFPTASSTYYPLTFSNGKLYATVTLTGNSYFSFAADSILVSLAVTSPSCSNPNAGAITSTVSGGTAPYTYLWSPTGQATANLSNIPAGTYSLTVTQGGCQATTQATVQSAGGSVTSPVVTATAITANSITFSWSAVPNAISYLVSVNGSPYAAPSSGSAGTTHTVSNLRPQQTVSISVVAVGGVACQSDPGNAEAVTYSDQIFVPNIFTPNGDGRNDVFRIYGTMIAAIELKVFNQWGELIYQTRDLQAGWNGTHNGKLQPSGVYVFAAKLTLIDGSEVNKRGAVNLAR
jgi:gliding motility-associated-like protein